MMLSPQSLQSGLASACDERAPDVYAHINAAVESGAFQYPASAIRTCRATSSEEVQRRGVPGKNEIDEIVREP